MSEHKAESDKNEGKVKRKEWLILEIFMKDIAPEWRKSKEDSVLRNQKDQKEESFKVSVMVEGQVVDQQDSWGSARAHSPMTLALLYSQCAAVMGYLGRHFRSRPLQKIKALKKDNAFLQSKRELTVFGHLLSAGTNLSILHIPFHLIITMQGRQKTDNCPCTPGGKMETQRGDRSQDSDQHLLTEVYIMLPPCRGQALA